MSVGPATFAVDTKGSARSLTLRRGAAPLPTLPALEAGSQARRAEKLCGLNPSAAASRSQRRGCCRTTH